MASAFPQSQASSGAQAARHATLRLRPISPEDLEFLFRVYASTREVELAPLGWTTQQTDEFLRMQFEAQHTYYQEHFPGAAFQIVELGGEPIGRLYADRRYGEIRLIDIALLTEHRGRGVGSRLMRDILGEAQGANLPVRIHVEQFNPAKRLYERLGFSVVGHTGVYDLMEWRPKQIGAR